jgi:transposase
LTIDRYLSYLVIQGSITSEVFESFVEEQVLLHCLLYPEPRSVLILDNVSIYKSARLQELYKQYSILLKFLPLYLPDFNPIEATFADIKAWIKRNHRLIEEFDSFEAFLYFAISQACRIYIKQYFEEAGYIVN